MSDDAKKTSSSPLKILGTLLLLALVWGADQLGLLRDKAAPETGTTVSETPRAPSGTEPAAEAPEEAPVTSDDGARRIAQAFRARESGFMVETSGVVDKVLFDDQEGSRHQRFILRLPTDGTVLVAHNIDLAPRVPLHQGDTVEVRGQYEWNDRGGVLHWTHHDPDGRHDEGWIRHSGTLYE